MTRLPLIPVDQNGRAFNDPLGHFKISDTDDASDPQYFGNLTVNGAWYVLKVNVSDKSYRYATGETGYTTAWTNRASLTYDYLLIFCILAILATGIYQGLHAEPPLPDSGAQLMTTQPAFIVVPVK